MTHPVIATAAEMSGFTPEEILSRRKQRELSSWRHRCYLSLRGRGLSYPQVGRIMGYRDHSTVIHGCAEAVRRLMASDAERLTWDAFTTRLKEIGVVTEAKWLDAFLAKSPPRRQKAMIVDAALHGVIDHATAEYLMERYDLVEA